MTKSIKQLLSALLFTFLGIFLVLWIYRGFDFAPLWRVFSVRGNYLWIVLSLLVGIAANVFRALRWRMLLAGAGIPVLRRRAVELVFISYLINSVTPRLGELTRSLLVRRGDATASARAFGTVVVEKMTDVACLVVVIAGAVVVRWEDTRLLVARLLEGIRAAVSASLFYGLVGALILLGIVLVWSKVRRLRELMGHLWQGAAAIVRLEHPWAFGGLCLAVWLCNFLQLYLLVPCFAALEGLDVLDVFFLFTAASVGVLLPTPGGAGPWHFAIVKTLVSVFGTEVSVAKLFALVTHGLKTALVMLLGLLAYLTYYWEIWVASRKRDSGRR